MCGLSSILIIASPDILSMNGAFTLISFCSFGFSNMHSFGKIGKDLFRKLKQQFHEFITPSTSNIFLIPGTRSMFLWISDISMYISNLYLCMSIIMGIVNKNFDKLPISHLNPLCYWCKFGQRIEWHTVQIVRLRNEFGMDVSHSVWFNEDFLKNRT